MKWFFLYKWYDKWYVWSLLFSFCWIAVVPELLAVDLPYKTYGFLRQSGQKKLRLQIVGKVVEVKSDKKRILIRVWQRNIVRQGEVLYILDQRNLVIGKLKVKNVFDTLYFGQMVSGVGHFHLIPAETKIGQLIKAEDKTQENYQIYLAKADNFFEQKIFGESVRYYKKALSIDGNDPHALFGLGKTYYYMKLMEPAEKMLQQAYQNRHFFNNAEDKGEMYIYLANFYIRKAEKSGIDADRKKRSAFLEKAQAMLLKANAQIPDSPQVFYYLGRVAMARQLDQKALEYFRSSIRYGNDFLFENYWYIAQIFKAKKMNKKATLFLQKALAIRPDNYRIKAELKNLQP